MNNYHQVDARQTCVIIKKLKKTLSNNLKIRHLEKIGFPIINSPKGMLFDTIEAISSTMAQSLCEARYPGMRVSIKNITYL